MEVHDLVLAKCVAGRARDWDFARDALGAGLVEMPELLSRIADLPIDSGRCVQVRKMLEGIGARLERE
jgi:hypothetical protein